ncbi:RHS repeat-associated core domain-containing protein, partial [Candidatus Pacearchaeota archaeon]|nr:RHS repeat-associated core domain-containing protein [Candidatus Pacearchaeota archaeon]
NDSRYFYLHDRLGSVRQLIDTSATVKNTYTYEPYGEAFTTETQETITNPWQFTGQYNDTEIDQCHLRARQYDPGIYRFTARDPVKGTFKEPMSLHAYLYCLNDPTNRIDLAGTMSFGEVLTTTGVKAFLAKALTSQIFKGAVAGAVNGAMFRGIISGYSSGDGKWDWDKARSGMLKGAAFGAIGGGVTGGLASLSSAGYLYAAFEQSAIAQGLIAGGTAGFAEGLYNREDAKRIFIRTSVAGVGGLFGGLLGQAQPPLSGIPGGVVGGEGAQFFYEYFMSWFGGLPSLND